MEMDISLDYLVFQPLFWLALGLALIAADVLLGLGFFMLPWGVSALLLAAILALFPYLMVSWVEALGLWAFLSVIVLVPLRRFYGRRRDGQKDINEY